MDRQAIFTYNVPFDATEATSFDGFSITYTQPADTDVGVVFRIDNTDDTWYKLDISDGVGEMVGVTASTADDIIDNGNTIAELLTVTSVPEFAGEEIQPMVAISADEDVTIVPTVKLGVKTTANGNIYNKTEISNEYNIEGFLIYNYDLSTTVNDASITITASTYDGSDWSEYATLSSIVGIEDAKKIKFKTVYTVTAVDGTSYAKVNHLYIYLRTANAKVSGVGADIITKTQDFGSGMMYARLLVKHNKLIDATMKAYASFSDVPLKRERYQLGTGTGSSQTFELTDEGIDYSTLEVYSNTTRRYDIGFNSLLNTVTITAPQGADITATYEYEVEPEEWHEMTKGSTQTYQDNATVDSTDFSYMVTGTEKGLSAIKITLEKPSGAAVDEYVGTASGFYQTFTLKHWARPATISAKSGTTPISSSHITYDDLTRKVTLVGLKGQPIYISYTYDAETPIVKGYVAAWNE